ncbi:hypothetical protein evm_014224 [Chilo suppressalis]|nr:hypothetical protein evm_014224 [Chilo suppressalis]
MAKCCIRGCNSSSRKNNEGLSFFRFPKNEDLRKLWIEKIGSENIKPAVVAKICSKHFEENCINRTLDVVRLKDDVVPTIFPFTSSSVRPRVALSGMTNNTVNITASSQPIQMDIDDLNPIRTEQPQLHTTCLLASHAEQGSTVCEDKAALKMAKTADKLHQQRKNEDP